MKLFFILLISFNISLVSGCSDSSQSGHGNIKDYESIIVISPAIAEILDQLGLIDRVVGIGQFGPWPQSISRLPVVGGYDSPNVEQIIRLKADLVLNVKSLAAMAAHRRLHKAGIEVMELDTSTVDGIFTTLKRLGNKFDRVKQARQITESMHTELDKIRKLSNELSRRRVLFIVGRNPIYVAGPGSHIDFMIELTGGENIAKDARAAYQQISLETVLEKLPEVIIDTSFNQEGAIRGRQAGHWGKWPFIPAVQNNRVYWVDPSQIVIPGIRLAEMTRLMGKFIHPEVFGEPTRQEYLPYNYASKDTSI